MAKGGKKLEARRTTRPLRPAARASCDRPFWAGRDAEQDVQEGLRGGAGSGWRSSWSSCRGGSRSKGLKVAVIFEGRDSAGKGGVIKRITYRTSPRVVHVVALQAPTEKERASGTSSATWPHLPSAGEMVLFDRSWYNRAGVERVMGFCTDAQYDEFMATVNGFELALVSSGTILIKYWLDIADETQEERFRGAHRRSAQALEALAPWTSRRAATGSTTRRARDAMLAQTSTAHRALVHRGRQHQAACPPQRHHPPAEPDPVPRTSRPRS